MKIDNKVHANCSEFDELEHESAEPEIVREVRKALEEDEESC